MDIISMQTAVQISGAILGLNALGGWTGLGWLVAFVWALTANVKVVSNNSERISESS